MAHMSLDSTTTGLCEFCRSLTFEKLFRDEVKRQGIGLATHTNGKDLTLTRLQKDCSICALLRSIGGKDTDRFERIRLVGREDKIEVYFEHEKGKTVKHHLNVHFGTGITSPVTLSVIRDWIGACSRHRQCKVSLSGKRFHNHLPLTALPKRLVDVGVGSGATARLVTTHKKHGQYIALSYCWKANDLPEVRLTKGTYESFYKRVELLKAPQTIQDTIEIVRLLGYRYIWIDSLCIVQDDDNDKAAELPKMGDIYTGAFFVIAALGAQDYNEGLFPAQSDGTVTLPCRIGDRDLGSMHLTIPPPQRFSSNFEYEVSRSRWQTRGWIFQERTLARRILYFGRTELYWKCRAGIIQGSGGYSSTLRPSVEDFFASGRGGTFGDVKDQLPATVRGVLDMASIGFRVLSPAMARLPRIGRHVKEIREEEREHQVRDAIRVWKEVVRPYSSCELTKSSDKFNALAGVSDLVQSMWGLTFCWGLWEEALIDGLLWRGAGPLKHPAPEEKSQDFYSALQAPSWSWAAWCGTILYSCLMWDHWSPVAEIMPSPAITTITIIPSLDADQSNARLVFVAECIYAAKTSPRPLVHNQDLVSQSSLLPRDINRDILFISAESADCCHPFDCRHRCITDRTGATIAILEFDCPEHIPVAVDLVVLCEKKKQRVTVSKGVEEKGIFVRELLFLIVVGDLVKEGCYRRCGVGAGYVEEGTESVLSTTAEKRTVTLI